jgi:small-conductance mechanosensitive channel
MAPGSRFPFGARTRNAMDHPYKTYLSILIVSGTVAVLLISRKVLFGALRRVARKTSPGEEFIVTSLQGPSTLLIVALALYLGLRLADIPQEYAGYAVKGIHLFIILTVTMALANISGRALAFFLTKVELPISVTSLINTVIKAMVYAIGILIMLNFIGISIAPIITALGVGGLAMALALQDTLSNLFAGIHILAEHTVRVGDLIRLETGQEGSVVDIGWRTTRIRTPQNNMVIVPNSKLSQSVVTNYYLPERPFILQMPIGVSYDADPDVVERVLLDEAHKAASDVTGLLGDPQPSVVFVPGFGASSLEFTLVCRVRDYTDQQSVKHELHKRILKRFRKEGIDIPFPTRTVYVKNTLPEGPLA